MGVLRMGDGSCWRFWCGGPGGWIGPGGVGWQWINSLVLPEYIFMEHLP